MKRFSGFGHISRGDVVVFNFPYQNYHSEWDTIRMNLNMFFVKRCIGLPGDSLSVIDGFYHIEGVTDLTGNLSGQNQLSKSANNLDSAFFFTIPFDSSFNWNVLNLGPFYIPAKGKTIPLTPSNYILYGKQIIYETQSQITIKNSSIYINDTLVNEYTFRNNWYFMVGDNVMNSQDSRHIGLIPEKYIVGKAFAFLYSKDMRTKKYRWNRLFKNIK